MTERTAVSAPAVVRLSGPQGLVAAVPMYLGFAPTDSLVVMCLRAPRGRVAPVMRVDLFPPDEPDPVEQLVSGALRYADSVAVVCYHDGDRPACLDVLLAALNDAGLPVTAVLSVRDGLIRDASDAATEGSDPGVPIPGPDDEQARTLAAASVMAGRQILSSRDALRASIAAPQDGHLARARAAIDDCCRALAEGLAAQDAGRARSSLPARADAALVRARREHSQAGAVTMGTAVELIVLAQDIPSRDLLVARAVGADDPDLVPLLIAVAGWCPDEDAPEICSVLAVTAYRYGDGALAHCAVDRVLAVRPDHRLAHLMLSVMAAGLPPGDLAAMADIATDPNGVEHAAD